MSALLAYYPSPALTQAEKNLARWQDQLATMQQVEHQVRAEAVHIFPQAFAQARLATAVERTARYAGFVEQAKNQVAAERASAYLSHTAAQAAADDDKTNWLIRAVGKLLTKLIQRFPSRVSQPALAY